MGEIALRSIKNNVFERDIHGFRPELYRERLIRLIAHVIEKGGIDGGWLFSNQSCERRSLRAMTLACRAEAVEQVNLERRGFRQLVRRQFRAALVEIVCYA